MRLIRSEIRKFFTTQTWIWLLLGAIIMSGIQAVVLLAFAGQGPQGEGGLPPIDSPIILTLVLAAPASATIFIAILGVIGITAEYRHKTIAPTFLVTPARWKVIAAKLVTYLLLGVAYALVAAVVIGILAAIWISAAGGSFTLAGDNWKVLLGAAISSGLYGIIGVGVGALIRNQIAAISGLLAYLFVIEPILSAIPATRDVYKFLPGGAGSSLYTYAQVPGAETNLLPPVVGGILLAGYALLLAALGYFFTTRREVS